MREWLALGISPRAHLRFAVWVCSVDLALAPIGLLAATSAGLGGFAFVATLPLIGLLELFARQRRLRIDHALELGQAYRGTAFLLGDMIEADDAYTGSHSQQVVELVLAVADELGVDADTRRDAEFAALLHDVGKIHVPNEIINKRGPLDDAEWEVMHRHTIDGETMLNRVGGLLARVGGIVRATHEHYDGSGYPDGLAGERDPARGADRQLLRRLQRDDDGSLLPQGAAARGRARRAATCGRDAVRSRASSRPSYASSSAATSSCVRLLCPRASRSYGWYWASSERTLSILTSAQ